MFTLKPFFFKRFGSISISGSGILINPNQGIVYTTATILSPFLKRSSTKDKLKLIKRTKIRVLLDDDSSSEENFLSAKFLKVIILLICYTSSNKIYYFFIVLIID